MRALNRTPRGRLVLLFLLAAVGLVLVLSHSDDDPPPEVAARSAAVTAPFYLADRPRQAALAALASQRLDPSFESEMAMLTVAGAQRGVKRVISTGSPQVEAAVRMYNLVITAGSDRQLRVWRASDGALLGEARTPKTLSALSHNPATTLLAGSDRAGRVTLIDVSDPRRPSLKPLRSRVDAKGGLLTLAFSPNGMELLGFSSTGTLSRIDITRDKASRKPLGRSPERLPRTAAGPSLSSKGKNSKLSCWPRRTGVWSASISARPGSSLSLPRGSFPAARPASPAKSTPNR